MNDVSCRRFRLRCIWFAAVLLAALPVAATAASPTVLPVQGALRTAEGTPVPDGTYVVTFALYDAVDAAEELYKEIHIAVPVKLAAFVVDIGGQDPKNPIPAGLFAQHDALWIGVKVSVEAELPRVRVAPVPFAIRATFADQLTGPLDGKQIATGTVPDTALAFGYAGSKGKGGAALDLDCTGCVTKSHLAADALDAKNVTYAAAGQTTSVYAVLLDMLTALKFDGVSVGIGKNPGNLCALDIASDGGDACVDGAPALLTRFAGGDVEMAKLAKDGQLVYRKDTGRVFVYAKSSWRELLYKAVCGDGAVDPPEECDDGQANADMADTCRTTCKNPACGDNIQDGGEACDDGNDSDTDACAQCQVAICGDGFVQGGVEACDDGNQLNTDACVACKAAVCGDGHLQAGVEECDDGNVNNGDGCSQVCKFCGDGTCQADKGETWQTCLGDCPKPLGTQANPAASCKALMDNGQKADGAYWLKWGAMGAPIQVWCDQTRDFGTGVAGGWMLYCGKSKANITAGTCANGNPTWAKMKAVDYHAHVQYSSQGDWWMSIETNVPITSTPVACDARMRVKSDIGGNGGWGKVDSGWMNNLHYSAPCGGDNGCRWGHSGSCDAGGIYLRANGNGYTTVDTMANGWTQITHGGGLGAAGGYAGGKHTNFGSGGTFASAADWDGYVR